MLQPAKVDNLYQRMGRRKLAFIAAAVVLVTTTFMLDMLSGPAKLSVSDIFSAVLYPDAVDVSFRTIVWTYRLPAACMALAVGAALAIAGAEMQTVLDNPLASPFTLGISAAASFGAALIMVFGARGWGVPAPLLVPLSAFACALMCSLVIYAFGRTRGAAVETVIAGGVALHFIFSSGVAFLQFIASEDTLQAIVFWTFGSLQGANWENLWILTVVLLATTLLLAAKAWQLTALRLGETHAYSLGIDVRKLRLVTLMLISLLTGTAVCFTGAIGFIGLVAPHLARMSVGEDQRFFLPMSALYGSLLVSSAALISKTLIPGTVFPIGIVTAAIGAPFLAGVALLNRRAYW